MRIAKEVSDVLKELKGIKATALVGTVSSGIADKHSDIDLVCLCRRIPATSNRRRILSRLKGIEFIDVGKATYDLMDYFVYRGIDISIWYDGLTWISFATNKWKKFIMDKPWMISTEERLNVIGKIYYSDILYDPEGIYKKLKKGLPQLDEKSIPPHKLEHLMRTVNGDLSPHGDYIKKATERKDPIALHAEFASLIEDYLLCLFKLNKKQYMTSKWALKFLKNMTIKPKNCEERLKRLAILGNDEVSVKKKRAILKSLVDDLVRILDKKGIKA